MAHSLNAIAKRVKQEGAVIVGVVLKTKTRRAIVFSTVCQTAGMELANLGSGGCLETPVTLRIKVGVGGLIDGEARVEVLDRSAPHAVAESIGAIIDFGGAEGGHDRVVERTCDFNAWNRDRDVIEYEHGG
jgi:hypothetical protein